MQVSRDQMACQKGRLDYRFEGHQGPAVCTKKAGALMSLLTVSSICQEKEY